MPPIIFTSPDTVQFPQVVDLLNKSVNIIAVVGAGISTSCGIPAFRGGPDGIYARYGKHVFDYVQIHSDQAIGKKYLQMIGDMKVMLETAAPSPTHQFLKMLAESGRLKRIYTQNIDDLEAKAGLKRVSALSDAQLQHKVVQLHGHLRKLFCGVCHYTTKFTLDFATRFQKEMSDIACPLCEETNRERGEQKRQRPVGKLQTFVVLQNGGPNPDGNLISEIFEVDFSSSPDLLLIIGTSLEIRAIRSFVSRLVGKNVPSILMDYQQVDFSGSQKLFFHLKGPCDLFALFLMKNITNLDLGNTNDILESNGSDDSEIIHSFEPLSLKGAQISLLQDPMPSSKSQFIVKTCDYCFMRKINCTIIDKVCDFCARNGKACTMTIQNQKNIAVANPRKRKSIKEKFVFSYEMAESSLRPEEITSLYCLPIRPDPSLLFEKNAIISLMTAKPPRSMKLSKAMEFSDHDHLSVLGRTFRMCNFYYHNFYRSSGLFLVNDNLSFGSISIRHSLCGNLQTFQDTFYHISSLEKEKKCREIHHIHNQWILKISERIRLDAMFCNLVFFVSSTNFLICKISYLSKSMKTVSFNLFSGFIYSSSDFIDSVFKQINMFGMIGKIQYVIVSDLAFKDLILKIYDQLCVKNDSIHLYFSIKYQFQEICHILETLSSSLSIGMQELEIASKILQEFMVLSRSFEKHYLNYSPLTHVEEMIRLSNLVTKLDEYDFNHSMTKLLILLKSKIQNCVKSYQNSCNFVGGLLDPSVFNIKNLSVLLSDVYALDMKITFKETCKREWDLIVHINHFNHDSKTIRLPTDHQFTLEDEIDLYWIEKDSFQCSSRERFWKEYETKLPRLFILARKLLDQQCFATYPTNLEIDQSLEIPVGKILDIVSWKGMIDNT